MRNLSKIIFILIGILTMLISCEKEVHITNPKMFSSPESPNMFDTVVHEMIVDVEIDGEKVNADSYDWEITDDSGNQIDFINTVDNKMTWIPKNPGIYTVSCQVTSDNKSITEIERYTVDFYAPSLYRHLIGDWSVKGKMDDNSEWISTFTFKEDYSYTSSLDSVINGQVISSLGKFGTDNIDCGNGRYFYITDLVDSNKFTGVIGYCELIQPPMPDQFSSFLENIQFDSDLKSFSLEASFTDYMVDTKEKPIYKVGFEFTRQ